MRNNQNVQTVAKSKPDEANKDNTIGTSSTLPAVPPPASKNKQELATKGIL